MKATRYYSDKQEKKVVKEVGGKQTPNSGATTFVKGDVCTGNWLIECKTCTNPKSSFSIKKDWIKKNREEAFAMRKKYQAIAFDFGDGENHYVISEKMFRKLVEITDEE